MLRPFTASYVFRCEWRVGPNSWPTFASLLSDVKGPLKKNTNQWKFHIRNERWKSPEIWPSSQAGDFWDKKHHEIGGSVEKRTNIVGLEFFILFLHRLPG